jgi:hypothetical protein
MNPKIFMLLSEIVIVTIAFGGGYIIFKKALDKEAAEKEHKRREAEEKEPRSNGPA